MATDLFADLVCASELETERERRARIVQLEQLHGRTALKLEARKVARTLELHSRAITRLPALSSDRRELVRLGLTDWAVSARVRALRMDTQAKRLRRLLQLSEPRSR